MARIDEANSITIWMHRSRSLSIEEQLKLSDILGHCDRYRAETESSERGSYNLKDAKELRALQSLGKRPWKKR